MGFELNDYILQDALTIKYGKNQKNVLDENGEFPILGTGGLMGYANQFLYNKPSVLIGRKGSIRKVKYIDEPFWTVDTLFYSEVNEEIVYPKYMYYYLSQIDFERYNEGTTIPSLRTETLNRISIKLPNKRNQKKILNIINPIEDKIKVNNNTIVIIEQLVQTLFKQWFVDFEFPNGNGEPYKSSGGEMVGSELGMIPVNWELVKLNEIIIHSKKTFNPKSTDTVEVAHFSLPAFDRQGYPLIEKSESIKSNKYYIDENSLMFSKMNPTTPRIWLPNILKNIENVCSSEFVVLDTSLNDNKAYIYALIKSESFTRFLIENASGSTNSRQRVIPTNAISYLFPYNRNTSLEFNDLVHSLYDKILVLRDVNQSLISLRDTLLPKLLSGEIEIPNETEVIENVPIS